MSHVKHDMLTRPEHLRCVVLSPGLRFVSSFGVYCMVNVVFSSNVKEIREGSVDVDTGNGVETIANDTVIVSAGGILPSAFLRTVGIHIETKWGSE